MLRATTPDLLVAAVAVATFAALAVPRVRGVPLSRALTAGLGAVAVVALGGLSPAAAFASVDPTTLLLVFGMLVHVEALSTSGVYGWAAAALANRAATTRRLTLGATCLAAGLSAVALNDATVILLAPVVLDAAATADADPTLPGIGLVVGANVGSLATPLGNPQNAYILARSAVSAGEFVRRLAPVAVVCLGLALLVLVPFTDRRRLPSVPEPSFDRGWAALGGGFLVGTLLLLVALPEIDAGALAAGTALAHLGAVQVGRRVPADEILERLDWGVLVLFVGLFVLTGAIRDDAVFVALLNTVEGAGVVGRTAAAFGLSAVVSNVPAVLLLAPVTAGETAWLRLAAVSTLAGNATPVASAATLIVLERARQSDQRLSILRLVAIGLPVSVLTTAVAVVLV